ncbi:hypothetical protein PHET_10333 [Paragonimus heterotremus]|uniref:Uncharacterized protein n=1 Tax=Paragonimus heterotremus TaxID=100268 RepID=A0A8J4T277_9TREM|nr:hypothetical protein PHET_10333 [Paragonimus heterotremus]
MVLTDDEPTRKKKFISGVQNQGTFHEYHHTRGAVSHHWKGPSYYMKAPQSRYLHLNEYDNSQEQELELNRFNHWCRYFPPEQRVAHAHDPMNLEWPQHAVFYSAHHNKWLNEHADTLIPRDARLFYNEEDWLKYKYMVETADLPGLNLSEINRRRNRAYGDQNLKGRGRSVPRENMKLYF